MHKITFYPVGNGDSCKIDLDCGKKMLFDYAQFYQPNDNKDHRIDLASALRDDLKADGRNYFDVVAFTHADKDHICGAAEFFYLEHAQKYQDDGRIKITELWVPAAFIIETGLDGDARILRAEARHRLKEGKGIRVFSRPDLLKNWLESEGLTIEDRKHLITDAGQLISGFEDGVEFFVHSPFAKHVDSTLVDRNSSALIFHVTLFVGEQKTNFMLIGDTTHEVLNDIVEITRNHKREERLEWDIYDIPHHCSYLALSSDKGENITDPIENIKWLLNQGNQGGILVSSSWPIPSNDEDNQPPHRQAANCYKQFATQINGKFVVTMAHPSVSKPEPLIITIDEFGATLKKTISLGTSAVISRTAPRAGV